METAEGPCLSFGALSSREPISTPLENLSRIGAHVSFLS